MSPLSLYYPCCRYYCHPLLSSTPLKRTKTAAQFSPPNSSFSYFFHPPHPEVSTRRSKSETARSRFVLQQTYYSLFRRNCSRKQCFSFFCLTLRVRWFIADLPVFIHRFLRSGVLTPVFSIAFVNAAQRCLTCVSLNNSLNHYRWHRHHLPAVSSTSLVRAIISHGLRELNLRWRVQTSLRFDVINVLSATSSNSSAASFPFSLLLLLLLVTFLSLPAADRKITSSVCPRSRPRDFERIRIVLSPCREEHVE